MVSKSTITLAAAVIAATLTALSATEAAARGQVRDNRGGVAQPDTSGPGRALPGKTYIKCIIPFCSHDFKPSRARVQDHRTAPDNHGGPRRPKT